MGWYKRPSMRRQLARAWSRYERQMWLALLPWLVGIALILGVVIGVAVSGGPSCAPR